MSSRPTGARGEWKSHFWIDCVLDPQDVAQALAAFQAADPRRVIQTLSLDQDNPPHLSLSRPFAAALHEIEPLRDRVARRLGKFPCFALGLGASLVELPGEDGQCTFGAILVGQGAHEAHAIIDDLDEVLGMFRKRPFCVPRVLHVSVCRWDGPPKPGAAYPPRCLWGTRPQLVTSVSARAGHLEFRIELQG
jgi:hypothetical protein